MPALSRYQPPKLMTSPEVFTRKGHPRLERRSKTKLWATVGNPIR